MITILFKSHWAKFSFSSHIYFSRDLNHPLGKRGREKKTMFFMWLRARTRGPDRVGLEPRYAVLYLQAFTYIMGNKAYGNNNYNNNRSIMLSSPPIISWFTQTPRGWDDITLWKARSTCQMTSVTCSVHRKDSATNSATFLSLNIDADRF